MTTLTVEHHPTVHVRTRSIAARAVAATKAYGKGDSVVRALDAVDVEFDVGRFTAIMGPSGSGKSTLMHCLAGLDDLTEGRVLIGDVDLTTLNALENITLPMNLAGRKPDRGWLDLVVATVGLENRLRHRPSELSGGQQQRVAVARALASRPDIVFADEPTGNLDSRTGAEILAFMRQAVWEMGQTIVMVTHDPVAASYADRVVFLADGHIVDELVEPTAESVLDRMKNLGR
jgi:putative ABC transport system ATP-binding protein